jgi:hypothetical protein
MQRNPEPRRRVGGSINAGQDNRSNSGLTSRLSTFASRPLSSFLAAFFTAFLFFFRFGFFAHRNSSNPRSQLLPAVLLRLFVRLVVADGAAGRRAD